MGSIVAIETYFQHLLQRLEQNASSRLALYEIVLFIDRVYNRHQPDIFQSYFRQLLPYASEYLDKESLKFHSPDFYFTLCKYIKYMAQDDFARDFHQRLRNMHEETRLHQTLVFLWLGEFDEAFYLWHPDWVKENRGLLRQALSVNGAIDTLSACKDFANNLRKNHFPAPELFQKLEALWESLLSTDYKNSVWIPLVQKNLFQINGSSSTTIEPLSLEMVRSPIEYIRDFITFNFTVDPGSDLIYQQAFETLHSLKRALAPGLHFLEKDDNKFYQRFHFPQKNFFYTGDSLGLGMAALHLCQLTQNGAYEDIYELKEPIVATGIVDANGMIEPINSDSLKEKLQTFYFSPFRHFLLSGENITDAKNHLEPFRRRFPGRNLMLHPASRVEDLLKNETLFSRRAREFPMFYQIKHYSRVFWPLLSVILALVVFVLVYVDFDDNPAYYQFNGPILSAYNKNHKFLWNQEFQEDLEFLNEDRDNNYRRKAIGDINGDGKNELLFSLRRGQSLCINHKGKILWKYDDHQPAQYGENNYTNGYNAYFHTIHDFNKDGKNEIFIAYIHERYFPVKIIRFSEAGDVLDIFYNSGHINSSLIFDYDGNGNDEFFFSGTNNDYNQGIVFALKYPHYSGHSPQLNLRYVLKSDSADHRPPWLYLRFPRPDMLPEYIHRPTIAGIFRESENRMTVIMRIDDISHLNYFCDERFNVLSFDVGDTFFRQFNTPKQSIWEQIDQKKFEEAMKKLQFWNGETFVDTFAVVEREKE
jgi:hypothetical protein